MIALAVDGLLGYEDAARLLGVSESHMRKLVASRRVPHVRLGKRCVRFRRPDLERWLDERTVEVAS